LERTLPVKPEIGIGFFMGLKLLKNQTIGTTRRGTDRLKSKIGNMD
jgi:hypothetical protein